ncbi:hypothetical protein GC163_04655 [bacterium]|nr:hypothetical protein [bacterium]
MNSLPVLNTDPDACLHRETPTRWQTLAVVLLITISAVLHAVMIWHAAPLQSANDRSRWCTVRALCETGSYEIDEVRQRPGWDTIDLIRRDGHFYSTKPPLQATWVAAVVAVLQRVTGWSFDRDLGQIHAVTLLLINGLPFVIGLMGLAAWYHQTDATPQVCLVGLSVAAFGTLISPFLTSLNNHTPAAWGVLIATLCWQWPPPSREGWQGIRFLLWGFSASWAAAHDLPAAAFAAAMGLFALRENWRWTLAAFVPAAIIPVAASLACNVAALGTWRPAYAGYGTDSYLFIEQGVPSYWLQPQGIDRNLDSPAMYLMNCLIGHHGWFSLTPIWLLVAWKSWATAANITAERRLYLRVMWLLSAIVIGFYLTRTENYNYGGVSCGLRWAIFLIPLWIIGLSYVFSQMTCACCQIGCTAVLLGLSVYSAWSPMSKAWQQPWLYQLAEQQGWIATKDPPPAFDHLLYSWFDHLPETTSEQPVWVEFARADDQDAATRIRLTCVGDIRLAGRNCADVRWSRYEYEVLVEERRWLIDREHFAAGRPSAECLRWADADVTPQAQQADLAHYRGLPLLKAYHPGYERYVQTPLRTDAFACQRAAAQCDVADEVTSRVYRHRSDIWLSREIPFGTARREVTVSDARSGEVLRREIWETIACEPAVSPTSPVTREMFTKPVPIFRQVASPARRAVRVQPEELMNSQ